MTQQIIASLNAIPLADMTLEDQQVFAEAVALLSAQAREIERLREAARAVNSELWWCAVQLGCDWKDADWRAKSSVGRAYDASVAALQTQAGGE